MAAKTVNAEVLVALINDLIEMEEQDAVWWEASAKEALAAGRHVARQLQEQRARACASNARRLRHILELAAN